MSSKTKVFDCLFVGGGIVGLATVYSLLLKNPKLKIAILEKEPKLGLHQTGRNSGVIHSGIYYKPGSLKANFAKRGGNLLRTFCTQYEIPFEMCGKIIVATSPEELPRLKNLEVRAKDNQISVERIAGSEISNFEPYCTGLEALLVKAAGIVDYKKVLEKLGEKILSLDSEIFFQSRFKDATLKNGNWVVQTSSVELNSKFLVNCGGLYSDKIATICGLNPGVKIVPFRGEYFTLAAEKSFLVRNLIYPVPNPDFPFLGVHLTRMMNGEIHAGPNAVLALGREAYFKSSFNPLEAFETLTYSGFWHLAVKNWREGLMEFRRSLSKNLFLKSLQRLIPDLKIEDLIPAKSGIRAQAIRPNGQLEDDFCILEGKNSLHILNAPSPAATASFAIGENLADRVLQIFSGP